jgi:uncharacterized protein
MGVELRPLGVACNIGCVYCYQDPMRSAGNYRQPYDLAKMKAALLRANEPFTLFGGEPLLVPIPDLEELFALGLEKFGHNSIQTNGTLVNDEHLRLFRTYKVGVGISIDGPDELNDLRWHRNLEQTRRSTARIEALIARLCADGTPPGLIVTLHRGNATAAHLPKMHDWVRRLDGLGVRSMRLHLLEIENETVRTRHALSLRENVEALLSFERLQPELRTIRFDLFGEMEALLLGQERDASCVWRTCDPYRTSAVVGIEGNGQSSNCGRTNKDGVDYTKADVAGYERYVALWRTPQAEGGCQGCRFFLMCRGQCPGTAIDGDWRNRSDGHGAGGRHGGRGGTRVASVHPHCVGQRSGPRTVGAAAGARASGVAPPGGRYGRGRSHPMRGAPRARCAETRIDPPRDGCGSRRA